MMVTWTTVMDPKKRYVSAWWREHPLGQSDLRVNKMHVQRGGKFSEGRYQPLLLTPELAR